MCLLKNLVSQPYASKADYAKPCATGCVLISAHRWQQVATA